MGQSDAALWLNISVRQVKRLTRVIGQVGAQGAICKRWGVPGNRRIPASGEANRAVYRRSEKG